MSKNSRTEKVRVTESADFGAYFLILAVVAVGALAYFSEDFGPRWAKVIEIVGAPFSLGLGESWVPSLTSMTDESSIVSPFRS